MFNTIVVVQARMASTRLPGKVLMPLGSHTLLAHCICRMQAANVGPVVVATSVGLEDDAVQVEAVRYGCTVVRGSAEDVLGRFVLASEAVPSRWVVRATADNPALDIGSAGRLVSALEAQNADYGGEQGLPYGSGVEVIAATVLHRIAALATDAYDREHVTPYVRNHAASFRIATPDAPADLRRPDLRLTVDTADDLRFMRQVLLATTGEPGSVPLQAIIAAADAVLRHPHAVRPVHGQA